ncbi:hypothetical protein GCM10027024_28080 [Microbacterium insulae]
MQKIDATQRLTGDDLTQWRRKVRHWNLNEEVPMSAWLGAWDVEQKAIVGTFVMEMVVTEHRGEHAVDFTGDRIAATVSDIVVTGDSLSLTTHLTKPLKGNALVELKLTGPDSFEGTGKIKFLPNSTFTGVRRGTS